MKVSGGLSQFCPHCGSIGARRLGPCAVCRMPVCEKCGNVQHVKGERSAVHDVCLRESGSAFSMIKFVE